MESQRSLLVKISELYYYENMSQLEIAKALQLSRPKVSRLLAQARRQGIVEISIADSVLFSFHHAQRLKELLGLSHVIVVPSGADKEQALLAAGRAAGNYLNEILHENMQIGISWGSAMDSLVQQFHPLRSMPSARILQLSGGVHTTAYNIDSRELTLRLARKLGAAYSILQAPLLVSCREVRDVLLREPELALHFRHFQSLDLALVGIGSMLPAQSMLYKAGYISLQESQAQIEAGFAADICANRIYKDGSIRPNAISDRLIAISLQQLRRIPNVLAVAVGEDKVLPILAAAKGGFIKTLITDEIAASSLLKALDK